MITFEIIQKLWQMLGTPDDYSKIAAHELDTINTPLGHPLVTIDADNRRHLLIPTAPETRLVDDKQSAGVHIISNEWGYEGKRRRYVDVVCLKTHLNGIFDLMLLDMLTALPDDFDYPDRVCRRVLNQWREFLIPEPNQLPDKSKLVGIWGELWMLYQLAKRSSGVLRMWTGPSGSRFDFLKDMTALEVKSTLQRKGTMITIHGHDQLESPEGGFLFFAVLKLEERPVGGKSISDMIDQLVEAGIERGQLLTTLLKVDLTPDMISQTDGLRLHLNEWSLYKVDEDFPKIISTSFKNDALPSGVLSINYQIDLSTQPPIPYDDDTKNEFLDQFAGGMQS